IFVVIAIPILIGILLNQLGIELPDENQFMSLVKKSPFIIIIVLYISSLISCRIYKAKDM
ncbi:MAG: hypothetical protein GX787_11165, partial [Tissierellia bacterium]|nr:hypothetical protein [Tissierellia bacterium]